MSDVLRAALAAAETQHAALGTLITNLRAVLGGPSLGEASRHAEATRLGQTASKTSWRR